MINSTTSTYLAKREILTFANKLSAGLKRPEVKFIADMIFGMLSSGSTLLTEISRSLKEDNYTKNTVDRLSRHLESGKNIMLERNYKDLIKDMLPLEPVILVDDTDIQKPTGKKFEALGHVRDGSARQELFSKGYINTEIVGLSKQNNQPISLFSHIHSSTQKNYRSTNTVTYYGIEQTIRILKGRRATFVFDRGYDANAMFDYLISRSQSFIIRATMKRLFFYKGRWHKAKTLMDSMKGKIKTELLFRENGREVKKECYISHINVKITAGKYPMKLIIIYGLSDIPMMLLTNRDILNKEDVVKTARMYFSRWRIEEYFRFKKQNFGFEKYRVRSMKKMNYLNQLLSFAITLLCIIGDKGQNNTLKGKINDAADALRTKIFFYYYRLSKGLRVILLNAKAGIRDWYKVKRKRTYQIEMKLIC